MNSHPCWVSSKDVPLLLRGFHVERGVSGIQKVSQKYPKSIKHYFLFLKSENRGILTEYVSGSIGAVSGWIRPPFEVSAQLRLGRAAYFPRGPHVNNFYREAAG